MFKLAWIIYLSILSRNFQTKTLISIGKNTDFRMSTKGLGSYRPLFVFLSTLDEYFSQTCSSIFAIFHESPD